MKNTTTVGFGEIMLRLGPPGFKRVRQTLPGSLDATFAGAEANVCTGICVLGGKARFITALPNNDLTLACETNLRGHGVDVDHIIKTDQGRMGIFFVETGANQRPSRVIYDREYSSISMTPKEAYNWDVLLENAGWLHISGITPALSEKAADAALAAVQAAAERGITVSCDLNFRNKLWNWEPGTSAKQLARRVMKRILDAGVSVVIGNEEDAEDVLGIKAGESDVHSGQLDIARYPEVAKKIVEQFPAVTHVAITLRESISATHNNWGAMLYHAPSKAVCFAPMEENQYTPYEIRHIVDRVGGGDSFAAGLVFALQDEELGAPEKALPFAVAASCLAHSLPGDFNLHRRSEVEALAKGSASGRVIR